MATFLQASPGIYKITNTISNKIYIGCASNVRTRINGHLYDLRKDKHNNSYLQKAWVKYGEESFIFEMIEECDITKLHAKEHYWVNKLNCLDRSIGYNLKPTDPNGCSIHSEETKKKIKDHHKKNNIKPNAKCYEAGKVYNHSELCKINLIEARKKLKDIDFKKLHREKRGKKIIDQSTGIIYSSLAEVCELLEITKGSFSRILLGKRKNKTTFKYL
jgi:group I intron endonuclease